MSNMNVNSILVTGANRGIGLQFVKKLLSQTNPPKHVFATCRSPDKAEELTKLTKQHSNLHVLQLDIVDYDKHQDIVKAVQEKVKDAGLNILVNNAGVLHRKSYHDVTVNEMKESYEVNAIAPLFLSKAMLPLLKTASKADNSTNCLKAAVINISTQLASIDDNKSSGMYPYRASKAALNMISSCLALDFAKEGIFVVALHPGWVRTDMGGSSAHLSIEESINGLFSVLNTITEKDRGLLYSYNGRVIPW